MIAAYLDLPEMQGKWDIKPTTQVTKKMVVHLSVDKF